uniref:Uncharacterized protein n=1 Tax=Nothoprocta perdicaria TaxID=30464 RepID=A0A8C6ZGV3_NOTPE
MSKPWRPLSSLPTASEPLPMQPFPSLLTILKHMPSPFLLSLQTHLCCETSHLQSPHVAIWILFSSCFLSLGKKEIKVRSMRFVEGGQRPRGLCRPDHLYTPKNSEMD